MTDSRRNPAKHATGPADGDSAGPVAFGAIIAGRAVDIIGVPGWPRRTWGPPAPGLPADVCADFESELAEFNGESDHVHLLVNYPPKVAVSKLVNSLKGVSARKLRHEFTGRVNRFSLNGHLWSPSYFAASCGGAPLSIVQQYIERQRRPPRGPGRPRS